MMMAGIAGITMLIFFGVAYSVFGEKIDDKNIATMHDFAYSVQNEILLASSVHPGYERIFTLPNRVQEIDYAISNSNDYLVVTYFKGDVVLPIPKVSGTISKGKVTLRNVNGEVQIS